MEFDDNEDVSDNDEEQPQIVVVRTGDLTAEEVERERQLIETGWFYHHRRRHHHQIIAQKAGDEEGIPHSGRGGRMRRVVHRQKKM